MTKLRWRYLIRRAGKTQKAAAQDMALSESTIVRWSEQAVPPYAAAYALLMYGLDEAGQAMAREQMLEGWPPSDRAAYVRGADFAP